MLIKQLRVPSRGNAGTYSGLDTRRALNKAGTLKEK